jgi:hypothetical protein
MKWDASKASAALHGPLGITYQPDEEANVIADYLEYQFTSHEVCDENRERLGESIVQALLASVYDIPLGGVGGSKTS